MLIRSDLPLCTRINDYLERVEIAMQKGAAMAELADDQPDPYKKRILVESGVAKALHDAYSGYEKIFEEIADEVDGGKPGGDAWHRKLLSQMRQPTSVRPAVLPPDLFDEIDDLRGFRHVFRASYGGDLRTDEIMRKFSRLAEVHQKLLRSLQELADHLDPNGIGCQP